MIFENLNLIEPPYLSFQEEGYTSTYTRTVDPRFTHERLGCAQTGTEKQQLFYPICKTINDHRKGIKALILTPTRELAIQIGECSLKLFVGTRTETRSDILGGVGQNLKQMRVAMEYNLSSDSGRFILT